MFAMRVSVRWVVLARSERILGDWAENIALLDGEEAHVTTIVRLCNNNCLLMRSRIAGDPIDLTRLLPPTEAPPTHPIKVKMLPYLRSMNYEQPIDYRLYQNMKKHRKVQMCKPNQPSELFLEGQMAYSAPRVHRHTRNRDHVLQLLTPHRTSKVIKSITDKILPQGMSAPPRQEETRREKRRTNNLTSHNIKPLLPKKIPNIDSSFQGPIRSQTSRKNNPSLSLQVNSSVEMRGSDLQKPLLYLDKKELGCIKAESFIVMEYPSLQVVTGARFRNCAEIASLTKIMTFYTAYQIAVQKSIVLAEEMVTIDEEAGEMTGTSAELVQGDVLSVEQLLYALMLPSGNDAALALANWAGKLLATNPEDTSPQAAFVARMNANAKALEMKQSTFGNPHGLPHFRNSSNPYELSLLVAKCLSLPLFLKVVGTQQYSAWITNSGVKKEVQWENTNKLLRRSGFVGVKTGVTVTAGPCLASCYQHSGKTFIVVLLRANKLSRRFKETRMLLGWTLRRYNPDLFHTAAKQLLKHEPLLDSDNSEDEQEFHYQKMDAGQIAKRNKILVYQL